MGKFLIIINISLTVAAIVLTRNLINPTLPANSNSTSTLLDTSVFEQTGMEDETGMGLPKLTRQESDILWEKNLFHPERTFEESLIEDLDIKEPEQVNEHFELMSIAQVANKSCASIRVIKKARSQRRRANNRRNNRRAKSPKKDTNQKIYMLNDSVGETGFKLTEIGIDYIVIKKGDQELTLRLDKGDESSEKRRQVAKKKIDAKTKKESAARNRIEASKKKQEKEPEKEVAKDTPKKTIPPPPPPPAFNRGVQQPATNQNSTNTSSAGQGNSQYPRPIRKR